MDDVDPGLVDEELQVAGPVVVERREQVDADAGRGHRGDEGHQLVQLLLGPRDEQHDGDAGERVGTPRR